MSNTGGGVGRSRDAALTRKQLPSIHLQSLVKTTKSEVSEAGFIPRREEKLSTFTAVRPRAGRAPGGLCFAPRPPPPGALGSAHMSCSAEGPASCDLSTWVRNLRGQAAPPDYQVRLTRASQEPRLSRSFTPSPLCQVCPEGGAQDTFACREQDTQRAGSPQRRQAPRRRTCHP